jgi:putative peptide zinc metalloprotease protein
VRPRTGQQLVFAGAAQPSVFVVVDGALEGRRPDDPSGHVRERLGAGGVVGLASALRGAPASLAWHTAGTTLLSVPSSAVVAAVGPLPGPPPADWADAEALFADAPALQGLSAEDRMGLISAARPANLPPGAPVMLNGPMDAVVIESGVIALPDGTELRRGTLIGPIGEGAGGTVATARTPTRLWTLPALSGLPLLLGGSTVAAAGSADAGAPPAVGVHPLSGYPPLAAPPGPPPTIDENVDGRFERRMWWLVMLLLLLALLITATNFLPGKAWAEMPVDRALLTATRGDLVADVGGKRVELDAGSRVYVAEGDSVTVRDRSTGTLTFRGGSVTVLCAGSESDVGPLWSDGSRRTSPNGELSVSSGRVLADTASTSAAFDALDLTVRSGGRTIENDGKAWYAVAPGTTEVSSGSVAVDGTVQAPTMSPLDCGDGRRVVPPGGTPSDTPAPPSDEPAPSLLPTPSTSPTPSPTPEPTAPGGPQVPPGGDDDDDDPDPGTTTRRPPTTRPPTTRPPATTRPPSSPPPPSPTRSPEPPPNEAPTISWELQPQGPLDQQFSEGTCNGQSSSSRFIVVVGDDKDAPADLSVSFSWSGFGSGGGAISGGSSRAGTVGPAQYPGESNGGGTITVTVTVTDSGKLSRSVSAEVTVMPCQPVIG